MTPVSGWITFGRLQRRLTAGVDCSKRRRNRHLHIRQRGQSEPVTRIIVIKQTIPNDPQSFMFASNFAGAFSLTHNGQESADVEPGVYQVSETVPAGWVQDSATQRRQRAGFINLSQGGP